jgi:hypothetical protein
MELNGALSNPFSHLKRLLNRTTTTRALIAGTAEMHVSSPPRRRQGAVLEAVRQVLEENACALPVAVIHAEVQRRLGAGIPHATVKDALAAHSHDRFRRTRRGVYRLRS